MMSRRTPQGEGYTVRKDGRKVLRTKILEEEIEELKKNYEELQRQNDALRAKEVLQMTLLSTAEIWLRRLNGMTADVPPPRPCSSTDDSSSSTTAQLEERIQYLKQHLVLPLAAASGSHSMQSSSPLGSATVLGGVPHAISTSSTAAAAAATAAGAPAAEAKARYNSKVTDNMARWFQSVTPEDVAAMEGYTVESIAIRLRDVTRKLAVAHWSALIEDDAQAAQDAFDLQEEMAKITISASINNEDMFVKVYGFNMETLQYQAPPPGHWMAVAKAINLTQAQKSDVYKIYEYASKQQAAAMKRQASIVQELQAILGQPGPQVRSTPTAVAEAISDNAAAGPAQFVSFATGGPVPTAAAAADACLPGCFEGTAAAAQAGAGELTSFGPDSLAALATAWEAVNPLSQDGRALLTDFCRDRVSNGVGHNGTTNSSSSSSSSSWLAPAGVLTLQDAERVNVLLEELVRVDMSVKQHTQQITVTFTNVMTPIQRAETILASYPYFVTTPEICGAVAQLEAEAQQQAKGGKGSHAVAK